MKKILVGFFGIFLVLGIVAGTGYALFSSQVTMTGMVLGTATPALEIAFHDKSTGLPYDAIGDGDTDPDYSSTLDFTGQSFQKLLPGEYDWGAFWLRNHSTDGHLNPEEYQEELDFSLKGSIVSAGGNWGLLKDVIRMRVCVFDNAEDNGCHATEQTDWYTMNSWLLVAKDFPGGELASGEERAYVINFFIPSGSGNEIAGKTITNMTMEVTGTQVL